MKINQFKKSLEKDNKIGRRFFIAGAIFFIAAATIFYLAFFSRMLKIDAVFVEGAVSVNEDEIKNMAISLMKINLFNKINRDSFILLPEREIKQAVLSRFAEIEDVLIVRNIKEKNIAIMIKERNPLAVWCQIAALQENVASSSLVLAEDRKMVSPEIERCYFVDEKGFIFKPAPSISGGIITTIYSQSDEKLELRGKVGDQMMLEFILAVKKEFSEVNFGVTEFFIKSKTFGDLEILTPEGWRIYFDLRGSAGSQINALKRVLAEEIKNQRNQLDYVDLRVANRVYYKLKN